MITERGYYRRCASENAIGGRGERGGGRGRTRFANSRLIEKLVRHKNGEITAAREKREKGWVITFLPYGTGGPGSAAIRLLTGPIRSLVVASMDVREKQIRPQSQPLRVFPFFLRYSY